MKYIKLFEDYKGKTERYPSKEFADVTKLDFVYKEWKLPIKDRDEAGYKVNQWFDQLDVKKTEEQASKNIMKFFDDLIKLNPELKELGEPTSWTQIFDFMYGAVSMYNIDDIKFYASMSMQQRIMYNKNPQHLETMAKIAKKAKAEIYWVMSPTTIKKIQQALKIK